MGWVPRPRFEVEPHAHHPRLRVPGGEQLFLSRPTEVAPGRPALPLLQSALNLTSGGKCAWWQRGE